jgi:hypothetical protein
MTTRIDWAEARPFIEQQTGPIHTAMQVNEGFNSEIAIIVHTQDDTFFVKGLRQDHPRVWTQARERAVNPFIIGISPRLCWSVDDGGWNLLGFEFISGRHVDYSPTSADLPAVVRMLRRLQGIQCPDIEMKQAEQRWAAYTSTPELFTGDRLLHTDWTQGNVLVNDGHAYLVDWAWPTKGAGWIDPACWTVWLIAGGHGPQSAEAWASKIPSWNTAPREALDAFAQVQADMWTGVADDSPDSWTQGVAEAAQLWAKYRGE